MESDSFNVNPSDVSGQAGSQDQYYYPASGQAYKNAGMSPFTAIAPLFANRTTQGGLMGQMGQNMMGKSASMYAQDADFYANELGDVGAAATLSQSKEGKSVFQMLEPHEFDMGEDGGQQTLRVVPSGQKMIQTPKGNFKVDNWRLAVNHQVNGVKQPIRSVPFRGGDEAGEKFRGVIADGKTLLSNLSRLEQLYKKNAIMSSIGPSQDSAEARGLEAGILMGYSKLMNGTKGVGAGVSDVDMELMSSMTPQRASRAFSRLKGNEMNLLKHVRQQTIEKIRSAAQANGIDLIADSQGKQNAMRESSLKSKSKEIE